MTMDAIEIPRDVTFPAVDGLPLRAWHWPTPAEARGTLVIAHGLGEHGLAYRRVAEAVGPRLGLDVLAFDFRGHGRSPGRRGVVRRYEDLTADLTGALDWAGGRRPGLPRFVLGHSNGGQVALRVAMGAHPGLSGLILSNPSLFLAVAVPRHKLMIGRVLRRMAPGITLSAHLPPEMLSRDPGSHAERVGDTLRHSRTSAPLFFGMVEGGPMLEAAADRIVVPTLVLLGDADPIVDAAATRAFFARLGAPDKTLISYPEALHEPLNDLEREQVIADLVGWIDRRL